jgi:hypothetical protein
MRRGMRRRKIRKRQRTIKGKDSRSTRRGKWTRIIRKHIEKEVEEQKKKMMMINFPEVTQQLTRWEDDY